MALRASPAAGRFWMRAGVEYVVAMAKRGVERKAKRAMRQVRSFRRRSGKTEHLYRKQLPRKTWPREAYHYQSRGRAADGKEPMTTALRHYQPEADPQWIYEKVYCQPARSRTGSRNCMSCRSTAPAAAISGPTVSRATDRCGLRVAAGVASASRRHRLCAAQVWTLRERLLNSVPRAGLGAAVVVHLPASFPFLPTSESSAGTGSVARIALVRPPSKLPSHPTATTYEEKPVRNRCRATSTRPPVSQHHQTTKIIPTPLCSA